MFVMKVIKRDNTIVDFDPQKIKSAILKARNASHSEISDEMCDLYTREIVSEIYDTYKNECSVEDIQDIVERTFVKYNKYEIAKAYIAYRQKRTNARSECRDIMKTVNDIISIDSKDSNLKRENANIDTNTAMGTMLKIGSEVSKEYYCRNLLKDHIAKAHIDGDIHIHDLDFYALTETCCQIDIKKLLHNGFSTGHGYLREPSNIISASALTCIAIQADQNDQHGGQAIPNFDYGLAPYVAKSYVKNIIKYLDMNDVIEEDINKVKSLLNDYIQKNNSILSEDGQKYTEEIIHCFIDTKYIIPESCIYKARKYTEKDTYQAMEAFIHNMNTLHSRAGAQVPFSSINYGTDTSPEGRLIMKSILDATWAGMGAGETPIFPIQIFKVKDGVNYNEGDPNYDLFKLAMKVSAKRLFPNFSFIDAPHNLQYYKEGHPETEIAYMGCRTRTIGNIYDKSREIVYGRGNLSFTSINLPRLAIEARKIYSQDIISSRSIESIFFDLLDEKITLIHEQLLDRFEVQCSKKVKNYPFLMGQGVWIDSDKLSPEDSVREVLKHGSLTTGFIGLAECLKMLTGYHHGESEKSQELGLRIVKYMRVRCDSKSEETGLNFALMATPAEGLSGTFIRKDKKKYGIIPEVTDREYYTNSFHVPVYYPIDAYHKIIIEAPYHELTNGGHISYVEMDGDPLKNLEAFESIIRLMHDTGIGYGSINHPVDRCSICGYTGIIDDRCPVCGNNGVDPVSVDLLKELKKVHPNIRIPE